MDGAKTAGGRKNGGRTVVHPTLRKMREGWGTHTLTIGNGWATGPENYPDTGMMVNEKCMFSS